MSSSALRASVNIILLLSSGSDADIVCEKRWRALIINAQKDRLKSLGDRPVVKFNMCPRGLVNPGYAIRRYHSPQ